jgi:hypothetical protein
MVRVFERKSKISAYQKIYGAHRQDVKFFDKKNIPNVFLTDEPKIFTKKL